LLLCVALIVIWIASYLAFAPFGQHWTTSWDGNSSYLDRGWIAQDGSFHLLRNDRLLNPPPTSEPYRHRHSGIDPMPGKYPAKTMFGFARTSHVSRWRVSTRTRQTTLTTQQISFPIWLPAMLFSILPLRRLTLAMRHRKRARGGLCPTCSYNLFGNTSGVCPECGIAIKP